MSLDVGEAKRQLSKDKTAIVQCADGELYYLRGFVSDFEAIGEPLEGGDERRHLLASVWQVTGYDSDEEGLVKDPRVTKAKRQRVVAGSSSSMHQRSGSSISVLPAVAAVQAKQPTGCEQMVSKGFPREPGTSAATSAAASGAAASSAPPPPVPLPPFSPRTDSPGTALGNPKRTALVEYAMLTRRYPLHHARDALHDDVADKLRRMEKYEIALQGDDYADKEHQKTNHEALAYARAAASVASMTNCKLSELCAGQLDGAVARLKQEPYISDFRARQIYALARTGTCEALTAFENDRPPIGSDGRKRMLNLAGRSMEGARGKRELSKVLGISAIRAAELWDGVHKGLPAIKSVAALRALPPSQQNALLCSSSSSIGSSSSSGGAVASLRRDVPAAPDDDDDDDDDQEGGAARANFSFGLAHNDELCEPIPAEEAEEMRAAVLRIVRRQQGCAGCACACTRTFVSTPLPRAPRQDALDAAPSPALPPPAPPVHAAVEHEAVTRDGDGLLLVMAPEPEPKLEGEPTSGGVGDGADSGAADGGGGLDGAAACSTGDGVAACGGCDCCWHVEFVGGAPRRGRAGHDVDLLVWHRHRPASWAAEPRRGAAGAQHKRTGSVLGMLLDELEDACRRGEGGLVPRQGGGWQMLRLCHHKRQPVGGVYAHRKPIEAANAESTHGYENLSMDYHDKVFGVWHTRAGRHRRIDIVVCSYPEELPLCRLTWVGGRLLNRLMRGYCLTHGLWLSAHALLVKSTGAPLLIDDDEARMVVRVPAAGEAAPAIVPYKFLRNERDVLYLLAGGSDAFFGLLDTRNRNA